jgi:hypothetical protein
LNDAALPLLDAQKGVFMSGLTSTEKLVLQAVLAHWSRSEANPWPSTARLAKWCSLHPKAIVRVIASLETKGALGVCRSHGRPNVYDMKAVFEGRLPSIISTPPPVTLDNRSPSVTGNPELPDRSPSVTAPVTLGYPNRSKKGSKKGSNLGREVAPPTETDPPSEPKRAAKRERRWTRVPADWQPNERHKTLAAQHRKDLAAEVEKFRDHEFRTPRTDADAAFRNWLRSSYGAASAVPRRGQTPTQPNYGFDLQLEELT